MKRKSIRIDARIHAAAKERLAAAGWDDIDFAVEYFLAECVVRKRLPAFLNWEKQRTCAVCKFHEASRAGSNVSINAGGKRRFA